MRILILSQWFDPEPNSKGLAFAKELLRRGHAVEVLTGFPNYPGGRLYDGYRMRPWRREVVQGVRIIRVPLYPSHDRSGFRRFLNYISFALSASIIGLLLVRRADAMYVYHPPITVGLPAILIRALRGIPFVYDVQDLWPDTVAATGMMTNSQLLRILGWWSQIVYNSANAISVVSPGFKRVLSARGIPADKIELIYNWADDSNIRHLPQDETLARELGLDRRFNVVFAGTMGLAQNLDAVLDAAQICEAAAPDIQFVLVGGGVDRARLGLRARDMQLGNVRFLPRLPIDKIGPVLALADVLLVHLKDDPLFRITVPWKTQAYLAAGKPIVMAVEGDAADLVRRAEAGLICKPEVPSAIAEAVLSLRALPKSEREAIGRSGQAFYHRELSLAAGVSRFDALFRRIGSACRGPSGAVR